MSQAVRFGRFSTMTIDDYVLGHDDHELLRLE